MNNIFYNGFGQEYIKPSDREVINRKSVYALIYIKDINKFVFIIPEYSTGVEFYKLAGGGVENEDLINNKLLPNCNVDNILTPYNCVFCGSGSWLHNSDQSPPPDYCWPSDHGSYENYYDLFNEYLEALNRELVEETNYPLKEHFVLKYINEYNFNFKPLNKDVFWNNEQRFCYFEVDTLKNSGYPSENWISELEGTDIVYLDPDYVFNNLDKIHVTVIDFIKDVQNKFFK